MERIDLLGQESDTKAAKWVSEDFKEKEKEEELAKMEAYQILENLKTDKLKYNSFLEKVFLHFANDEDIPKSMRVWTKPTKKGLTLGITGTDFVGAFESSGIQKYDTWLVRLWQYV